MPRPWAASLLGQALGVQITDHGKGSFSRGGEVTDQTGPPISITDNTDLNHIFFSSAISAKRCFLGGNPGTQHFPRNPNKPLGKISPHPNHLEEIADKEPSRWEKDHVSSGHRLGEHLEPTPGPQIEPQIGQHGSEDKFIESGPINFHCRITFWFWLATGSSSGVTKLLVFCTTARMELKAKSPEEATNSRKPR